LLNIDADIHDLLEKNREGVFEWKDQDKWNPVFLKYFQTRNDDDLSEEETTKKTS
jgi:hemerythrin superfamily protein